MSEAKKSHLMRVSTEARAFLIGKLLELQQEQRDPSLAVAAALDRALGITKKETK